MNGHAGDSTSLAPPDRRMPSISPRYKWYLVAMLWCISFFNYADRQAISSVLPLLEEEMGLTLQQQGLVVFSFAWVYGLSAPFAGAIVDRIRRKTAILGGLYVWSLICMATASSRKLAHLVFFRAAEGLGETFYYPASVSILSDYHGKKTRSRGLSFHQTSVYIGTIGGGFFAGLIGQHYGWRWSFILFGGLGILLGVVLSRFIVEPRRGASDVEDAETTDLAPRPALSLLETLLLIRRTPTLIALMLAFLFANSVFLILFAWMPSFLFIKYHQSLSSAGLFATLFIQLATMAGCPLGGWLADTLRQRTPGGRILVQALGVLGSAPFVFVCGQTDSLTLVLACLTTWGLFKGFYDANIFASAFDVIPAEARGTTVGLMNMVGWAGGACASWISTSIASRYEDLPALAAHTVGSGATSGGTGPIAAATALMTGRAHGLSLAISSAALSYIIAGSLLLIAGLVLVKRDIVH
jgi:MFS family permease